MQLCIQSYLSEELDFIAVTARTTTGTDVWETLLVNHICSQVEVLTEKKTWLTVSRVGEEELAIWRRSLSKSFSSTFLFKLSFRFSFIYVFVFPCLFHLYVSHTFFLVCLANGYLCYLHLLFLSIFQSACLSVCSLCDFIFFHPSVRLFSFSVTSYFFIRLSVCFLFLSLIVYMYFLSFPQPQPNHIHTRERTTCHKQTLEQDVIRKQSNLWFDFLSSEYLYYI